MGQIKVFLDSDVIVSAFLSSKGASFEIVKNSNIAKVISESIKIEVEDVSKRLNFSAADKGIVEGIEVVTLKLEKARIVEKYFPYVLDEEDSHVVAGAEKAKVRFLLTHNTRHFQTEKIKRDFGILTMKPGIFLQFLRSN